MIYRLYPQTKVMVDDRHDLYGEQFFKQYLKMVQIEPQWEQVLNEATGSMQVLIPAHRPWRICLKNRRNGSWFMRTKWECFSSADIVLNP